MVNYLGIKVNEGIFLKDPESSDLGRRIVSGSIGLIDEMGFEAFTFRKLAQHIDSTEASVYRYFESKHRLLLYLSCWYWRWLDYRLVLATANISSATERLERAITVLVEQVQEDMEFSYMNEVKLNRIIISESSKSYLTKHVDQENKEGFFLDYKGLVERVSQIILELSPNYPFPHMLVSTVIEGAHMQRYFADHLPRLTDTHVRRDAVLEFYREMVFKAIG